MKKEPYKTPLRYPGGKQRLAPFISEVLVANDLLGAEYVEPYAGGAGVAIELLLTGKVTRIHLNDSCEAIFAFWSSVLNHCEEFCKRITNTRLTVKEWKIHRDILKRTAEFETLDVGFSAFYLNRCNRSGIIAGGGVIGGLEQAGEWKMDARYPKDRLIKRIRAIAEKRDSIKLTKLDAEDFLKNCIPGLPKETLLYCDPPYFEKAHGLYFNHYQPADHIKIARVIQKLERPWIVSYDKVPKILDCYSERRKFAYSLQYNAASARKGKEVFIFSDNLKIPGQSMLPFVNRALTRFRNSGGKTGPHRAANYFSRVKSAANAPGKTCCGPVLQKQSLMH